MSNRSDVSRERLVEFSKEHLYYEFKMLFGVLEQIEKGPDNVFVHNALIESLVIHCMVILEFFYKPRLKPDDAKAIDYMTNKRQWREKLPSYDRYFRKLHRKRNRELVHLSYKRLDVTGDSKIWQSTKTINHIKKLIKLFLANADKNCIDSKLFELKANLA